MKVKKLESCYSPSYDITFIMEETYKDGEIISSEVKGFYYGEPDEEATEYFNGKLKAEYEMPILFKYK